MNDLNERNEVQLHAAILVTYVTSNLYKVKVKQAKQWFS